MGNLKAPLEGLKGPQWTYGRLMRPKEDLGKDDQGIVNYVRLKWFHKGPKVTCADLKEPMRS